jgi:hypothetical protein
LPGIRRVQEGYSGVGVVFSRSSHREIAYCQRCLKLANRHSILGNRIYLPDEFGNTTIPPDADDWLQCHKCGTIYPRYEAKQEGDIVTLTEPHDNPFAWGRNNIQTSDSRKFDRTCKTQTKKQFKQDLSEYKEEDIKEALRKGAKLVNYVEF